MVTSDFIGWLAKELDQRSWTQADLARSAGVSRAQVSRVLSGMSSPGKAFCRQIARAMHITPETVFREAGLLPPEPKETKRSREAQQLFGDLSDQQQETMLAIMRTLIEERRRRRELEAKRETG